MGRKENICYPDGEGNLGKNDQELNTYAREREKHMRTKFRWFVNMMKLPFVNETVRR